MAAAVKVTASVVRFLQFVLEVPQVPHVTVEHFALLFLL